MFAGKKKTSGSPEGKTLLWRESYVNEYKRISEMRSPCSHLGGGMTFPHTENGKTYFLDADGVMVSGKWVQLNGKWYYFQSDGTLAVNTTVDGYTIGADGARKED
jgi:hypothetical protein